MITVIQRVSGAAVSVDRVIVAEIGAGILALVAVEPEDSPREADRLLERVLNYRIFPDADDRMNLSLRDTGGGLLLVPQFTLAADTRKGNRPSFGSAAAPEKGRTLFDYLADKAFKLHPDVACGRFGANMQVSLVNDGPVTFMLRVGAG
ncbi:MAG: D-aminoacyl-tRNA deacylase [Gammaproteobacteria bacterium]